MTSKERKSTSCEDAGRALFLQLSWGLHCHAALMHNDPRVIADFDINKDATQHGLECTLDIVDPKTGQIEARTSLHPFLHVTDRDDRILESTPRGLFYKGQRIHDEYGEWKQNDDSDITVFVMKDEIIKWIEHNRYVPTKQSKVLYCDTHIPSHQTPITHELQLFAYYAWDDAAGPVAIRVPPGYDLAIYDPEGLTAMCEKAFCALPICNGRPYLSTTPYCVEHCCYTLYCKNVSFTDARYCHEHHCPIGGCDREVRDKQSQYCKEHSCHYIGYIDDPHPYLPKITGYGRYRQDVPCTETVVPGMTVCSKHICQHPDCKVPAQKYKSHCTEHSQ